MKKFSIEELAKIIGAHFERAAGHASYFTGVSIDSRTTQAGDCFFAVPGANFDGHDYVADAFAKGAACAVVNTQYAILASSEAKARNTNYPDPRPLLSASSFIASYWMSLP